MSLAQQMDAATYQRAERLLVHNRSTLVAGGKVAPRWIGEGSRFWYRVEGPAGHRFVHVDPAVGTREPAFDHERLAKALEEASGSPAHAEALPFGGIEVTAEAVEFDAFDTHWRCSLDTYACEKVEGHQPPNMLEVPSPDGRWAVFRQGYDLWIRSLDTGEAKPLTSDGTADHAYGTQPDSLTYGQLLRKLGAPTLPPLVVWSPDSRRVITHRLDQRGVRQSHLVESVPPDGGRPVVHAYHYAMPGDEVVPQGRFVVFDVETGDVVPSQGEPLLMSMISPILFKRVWWAQDGSAVHYLDQPRDLKTLRLDRLDAVTGEVRTLMQESGEPRVEPGQVMGQTILRVLPSGREVLWYSQRDGWGHLYLYDLRSGELIGQVTAGEWAVQQILRVDEDERVVYFTATGLVAEDPYRRQVCRVGLDGTGFARLIDDDLDHAVTVPANEEYYLDSASTVGTPPVTSVRGWDGAVLVELERADVTALLATGWTPREQFTVKAADGVTDIHGVLHLPHDFDPERRYPVLDSPYPGPQKGRLEPSFDGEPRRDCEADALAALGFVVFQVDGRGLPGRSKAFHDHAYGRYDTAGFLEDHLAALRQLAATRPWLDLDRVGVYGDSGGGYATMRAMCAFPDFYKVGVSGCGNHDQRIYHLAWGETYDGPLDEETYIRSSNVEIADRLQGKLLLIHGEMDDNVHPHQTLRLVDRLIAANKDFDLLIVPGAEHLFFGYEAYVIRRRWDFLVRHLLGVEPPAGYRIADVPLNPNVLAALG
ncbi:DPP IV N-terminal domain-containing protein [Rhizohabitans arisaemae]|uniref:S9 family peptidase n=1 Tax=Rhizohabitans arisaemae TaxID=2720610 RepID=UPI003D160CB6